MNGKWTKSATTLRKCHWCISHHSLTISNKSFHECRRTSIMVIKAWLNTAPLWMLMVNYRSCHILDDETHPIIFLQKIVFFRKNQVFRSNQANRELLGCGLPVQAENETVYRDDEQVFSCPLLPVGVSLLHPGSVIVLKQPSFVLIIVCL